MKIEVGTCGGNVVSSFPAFFFAMAAFFNLGKW